MRKFFILSFVLFSAVMALQASEVVYTADNTSIFRNPERGYYVEFDHVVTQSKPYCIKGRESELDAYIAQDQLTLMVVLYYLDNFKEIDELPEYVLDGFDADMQVLRDKGMKCILRFAYTASDEGEIGYDAPLERVEKHIGQYKRHWEENEDVIYCFQAGFVGAWGEWYYTSNFGNKVSTMNASRRALIDTLLKAVPEDRYIQIRTPLFKTGYIGDTEPLTKEEAYSGSPRARLGHHNDAFLYGPSNMGTYADTATQKPYLAKETLYVPMGGETDILDKADAEKWATREKTIAEMSRLHWTFIQGYYSQTVTDMWRKNGTFDELNRNMGYRYQLVSGNFSDEVEQGKPISVQLQIRNAGFAPLYNERHAYIILKGVQNTEYRIQMSVDPRTWLPNGEVSEVNEQLTIPSNVPVGIYRLYLYLPDAYESLADDPRYAIRFANEDVWDSEKGWNDLGATVTVFEASYVPGTPIALPATFSKANVSYCSDNMSWYKGDYFDFGPEDGENLDRWAEWIVDLQYPGEYIVSEVMEGVWAEDEETGELFLLGHTWKLSLVQNSDTISSYITEPIWEEGEITYDAKWDLSEVAKGVYTLHIRNSEKWLQPKLKSLTLEYDGEIPSGVESVTEAADGRMYDLLGRPVGAGYQGIVVMQGKKLFVTK